MSQRIFFYFTSLALLIFNSGCASKRNFVYFQDQKLIQPKSKFDLKLSQGDLLNIQVYGCDEESIKIFNIPSSSLPSSNRGYFVGATVPQGYLINSNGEIDFPVIGIIKLEGFTLDNAVEIIKSKLSIYLKDPKVSIQIQNFKVTVLGDVKNPGTIQVPNEKITLLEAIGIAGDLNISALRKNIIVLRDEGLSKKEFRVDITNKDFIDSPVYYLHQNDVVYVEANQTKINSSKVSGSSSIIVAISSLIITTINILTR
jgi:polysaccharide export outer membrane protein